MSSTEDSSTEDETSSTEELMGKAEEMRWICEKFKMLFNCDVWTWKVSSMEDEEEGMDDEMEWFFICFLLFWLWIRLMCEEERINGGIEWNGMDDEQWVESGLMNDEWVSILFSYRLYSSSSISLSTGESREEECFGRAKKLDNRGE